MKVVSDKHGEVVRHYRTIEIEDGPVIDAGDAVSASYILGTMFRATKLKMEWIGATEPVTVLVEGPSESGSGRIYSVRYRMQDGLPQWIQEILQ
jgi:hypothetical protein